MGGQAELSSLPISIMSTNYLTTRIIPHSKRVCALYKQGLNILRSTHVHPHVIRVHQVMLRARFDEHKDLKDIVEAKRLVIMGEAELKRNMHPQPFKYPNSPGGTSFDNGFEAYDDILDNWYPAERAMFPDYFAKRAERKEQYIEAWNAKYGKPGEEGSHV